MTENQEKIGVSSFGTRLQRYRKALNLSGEELADQIKTSFKSSTLSRSIIANIENGRRKVTKLDEIVQLAKGLSISPLALICDLEQPLLPADNPVFRGMTNYSVSQLFLTKNLEFPTARPLDNLIGIYSVFNRYLTYRASLLRAMREFDDFVSGKIEEESNSHDEEHSLFGALAYNNSCETYLAEVKELYDQLEKVNVIIPGEERERFHRVELRIKKIRKTAKDKKLITPELQEEYNQWERDFESRYEANLDDEDTF